MKKTHFTLLIAITIALLTGCNTTKASTISDTGITNLYQYSDYDFWHKDNELRIDTDFSIKTVSGQEQSFKETGKQDLPAKYKKLTKELRAGIIQFFKVKYNVDISEKLNKQQIKVFTVQNNTQNSETFGYVDIHNENILNLNSILFSEEYCDLFSNTYVHESLHQLGLLDINDKLLNEGLTDAFSDLILCFLGKESHPTECYYEARQLAYQIIQVDKELPHLYFETENFSLSKKITEKLKDIPRVNKECTKPGRALVNLLSILYANTWGDLQCKTDLYYYAHDAQAITVAYCRTFNPTEEEIDYIRSHYLVTDFEDEYTVTYAE